MALKLHYHPLSSFCWKALIALYENDVPFEPVVVNFGEGASRAAFQALAPLGKIPVLEDEARGEAVAETSVILEYLDLHYPGPVRLIPIDPDLAWRARLLDRIFDLHLQAPMQKIVGDRLRPEGQKDPLGVAQARAQLRGAYNVVERAAGAGGWLTGGTFGLVECAAAPALYYGDKVEPLGSEHAAARAYLERLKGRPSVARTLKEAEPFFQYFPAG
jgi:glutathione S-transferase